MPLLGVNCGTVNHLAAIEMVPSEPDNQESPKIPVVNVERRIRLRALESLSGTSIQRLLVRDMRDIGDRR